MCVAILKLCREKQAWSHLIANSQLLAKRRSQSKVAITGIVAQGLEQLEDTAIKLDDATREELLKTLCDVTDGKMYCEAERAKLTRMLSALKERQGDVASAADILQDVNVETRVFGVRGETRHRHAVAARGPSVPCRCRQHRARQSEPRPTRHRHAVAARRRGDGVSHEPRRARGRVASTRARHRRHRRISNAGTAHYQREKRSTTSSTRCDSCSRKETECGLHPLKKVQRKTLEEDDLQDLKVRFYKLMSEYHVSRTRRSTSRKISGPYLTRRRSRTTRASWRDALSSTALFLALSQHAPGVSDMMHRVLADATASPKLEKLPTAKHLLTLFTTQKLWRIRLTEEHQRAVEAHPALHTAGAEIHQRWKNTLRERVIQHNIRVV